MARKASKSPKKFYAIDLFSGCGGLSLGLEQAGFEVRAAVEVDRVAARTYRENHPDTRLISRNIERVTSGDLRKAARLGSATIDLLAGCPPCQGFSRIKRKNQKGKYDIRNKLILDYLRLAKGLNPKVILLENVPGLEEDHRFKKMCGVLERKGYEISFSVCDAKNFGVPQRRKRLIMIASRVGEIKIPKGGRVRKKVRDCIESLPYPREGQKDVLQKMHLKNTPRIKELIKKIPRNGGSRAALGKRVQLRCHKKIEGFKDVYGRMKWDDVAPTLTGGCFNPSKGRFLHPTQNRAITLREAARLQTFPDDYYLPVEAGLSTVARMIGDALPPHLGKKQGLHIIKHLRSLTAK